MHSFNNDVSIRHKISCWRYKDEHSEACKNYTAQWGTDKWREVPEYAQGDIGVHQRDTPDAKWKDQRMSPEGMTSKLPIKEELARGQGEAGWPFQKIPGEGNSGHCCHSSSSPFLQLSRHTLNYIGQAWFLPQKLSYKEQYFKFAIE